MMEQIEQIVFTPAALIELLVGIDELKNCEIGLTETIDGNLQLQINNSIYEISLDNTEQVEVEPEVVEQIDDINTQTYEALSENDGLVLDTNPQPIESGIIKEAVKTLLVGGAIRFATNLLK